MRTKTSRSPESDLPDWARELGAEVRRKRKVLRLTQKELADLAHCGPDFLYDLERGKPTVRLDKLVPVLEMLGLRLRLEPRLELSPSPAGVLVGANAPTLAGNREDGDWISSTPGSKR